MKTTSSYKRQSLLGLLQQHVMKDWICMILTLRLEASIKQMFYYLCQGGYTAPVHL